MVPRPSSDCRDRKCAAGSREPLGPSPLVASLDVHAQLRPRMTRLRGRPRRLPDLPARYQRHGPPFGRVVDPYRPRLRSQSGDVHCEATDDRPHPRPDTARAMKSLMAASRDAETRRECCPRASWAASTSRRAVALASVDAVADGDRVGPLDRRGTGLPDWEVRKELYFLAPHWGRKRYCWPADPRGRSCASIWGQQSRRVGRRRTVSLTLHGLSLLRSLSIVLCSLPCRPY